MHERVKIKMYCYYTKVEYRVQLLFVVYCKMFFAVMNQHQQ